MTVQSRVDNTNFPFILSGSALKKGGQVLLQDAGRAIPLAFGTLMAKVAASGKWVPFTDETATNGAAIPQGIYVGEEIAAADIVAGDIPDLEIIIGGGAITVDSQQVVIESSKLLTTVITVGTTDLRTVEDHMKNVGIFFELTIDIDELENT